MKLAALGVATLATGGQALVNHHVGATFGQVGAQASDSHEAVDSRGLYTGGANRTAAKESAEKVVASMKVYTKAEVMARMTQEQAVDTFLGMRSSYKTTDLTAVVQEALQKEQKDAPLPVAMIKQMHTLMKGFAKHNKTDPAYSAVDSATTMLNEMSEDTRRNFDAEVEKCGAEHLRATKEMETMHIAVSNFNAAAAGARGRVLGSQGKISSVGIAVRDTSDAFDEHKKNCHQEITSLNDQLRVAYADIGVMRTVLSMMACGEDGSVQQQQQGPPPQGGQSISLVKCGQCANKVLLDHPVQQMLGGLKSKVALQFVHDSLEASYDDSLNGTDAKPLSSEGVKSLLSLVSGHGVVRQGFRNPQEQVVWEQYLGDNTFCMQSNQVEVQSKEQCQEQAELSGAQFYQYSGDEHKWCDVVDTCETPVTNTTKAWKIWRRADELFGTVSLNTSAIPTAPVVPDCVATNKCTIGATPNCQKLKDRFLVVMAGILDKRNELEFELRERETFCEEQTKTYTDQINGMQNKLRDEREALAIATGEQNEAETGSHTQSAAHDAASLEFVRNMQECCDNKNAMTSELCALGKIRGELNNMEGEKVYITDCEVSDWNEAECSVSCGGGSFKSTRNVLTHMVGKGLSCPPLEKSESCNDIPCPIDCVAGDWSQWSSCSAECGGGVRARSRPVTVEPLHEGEPCGQTEEAQSCGDDACDVECVLSDWGEWGACSRACGGGTNRRERTEVTAARGTGTCADPFADTRLQFIPCNQDSCQEKLKEFNGVEGTRTLLKCGSLVDLIIMVDGSGSLDDYGWMMSKRIAATVTQQMSDGSGNAQVSVVLFSGPGNLPDYEACTQNATAQVDTAAQCKVSLVSHFTNETAQLAMKTRTLAWPGGSTLTSVAIGVAESELKYSRAEATSKVVIITDGAPMSAYNTKAAAKALQEKAQVIWVPIGKSAPFELIAAMASKPLSDHVIPVPAGFTSFKGNETAFNMVTNKIVTSLCPIVG